MAKKGLAVDENAKISKEKLKTDMETAIEKLREKVGKRWKIIKPCFCYDRYVIDKLAAEGKIEIANEEYEVEGAIKVRLC